MTSARTRPLWLIAGAIGGWVLIRLAFLAVTTPGPLPAPLGPPSLVFADAGAFDTLLLPPLPASPIVDMRDRLSIAPQRRSAAGNAALSDRQRWPDTARSRIAEPPSSLRDHRLVAAQSLLLARMLGRGPYGARALGFVGPARAAGERALPAFIPARQPPHNRWSLSAGLFVRRGSGSATLGGGVPLGGTQAWVRAGWQAGGAGSGGSPEIFARATSAGRLGNGAEVAMGIAHRPISGLPVQLVAERRQRIGNEGRSAFAAYAVGGSSATMRGWQLDGYGAAGVIGARRRDAFAEGSATLARPVARLGGLELSAGGGTWGAAQPGVERLDMGPTLTMRSDRLDGARLALDWRQRVAGNATPNSGPALTLSVDF